MKKKLTTVKDLIEELQKLNQDAVVTYAYNEYGLRGVHKFIVNDQVVCFNADGTIFVTDDNDLLFRDINDLEEELVDGCPKYDDPEYKWLPCVKLFAD